MLHDDRERREQELLVEYLHDRNVPCPSCGYSLRGLKTGRCPECNQGLELGVVLCEVKWGAFIAGIAGCCAGWMFCAMILVYAIFKHLNLREATPLLIGLGVSSLLLCAWLVGRRTIQRWGESRAWLVASVVSMGSLAGPVAFLVLVA